MSIVNKGYSNYLNQIPTGNIQQVIMLYKGTIRHMNKVIESIKSNDIESRFNLLEKATGIIFGLRDSLDHKNAEGISKILENYYNHIYIRMMNIHHSPNIELCEEILRDLNRMLDSWYEVEKSIEKDLNTNTSKE